MSKESIALALAVRRRRIQKFAHGGITQEDPHKDDALDNEPLALEEAEADLDDSEDTSLDEQKSPKDRKKARIEAIMRMVGQRHSAR